jgi:hypothetical protein
VRNKKQLLLLSLLFGTFIFAQELEITNGSIRSSFENISISPDEDMGLLGMSYLLEPNDNFYYGASVYGAMSGDRGGFFVGGFTAGAKYSIFKDLYLDGGAFVGGGGGASAGQGGGLMLKSYAGLLYTFDKYSLGLNYSYVTFPNGDIDSSQVSLVADMKFDTIFVDTPLDMKTLRSYHLVNNNDYVVGTYQTYFPTSNLKTRSSKTLENNINLVGIEYGANINKHVIAYFESAGAMKGATGYMEVLGGLGYDQELFPNTKLQAKLSLGGAGGGDVDTSGGTVTKASLKLAYSPIKKITTGLEGGYYHAFDGGFDATFAKVNIGINADFLSLGGVGNDLDYSSIASQKFNIRFTNQTYLYSDTLSIKTNNNDNVQLFGTKLDWFLSDSFYITGQAFAAYSGDAGGYAVGMFGLGYVQALFYDFSLVGEVCIGAAGGGSINTGGGNIVQPMAGLMYDLSENFSIEAMYGKVLALNGDLDSNTLDVSIVYKFNKLVQK